MLFWLNRDSDNRIEYRRIGYDIEILVSSTKIHIFFQYMTGYHFIVQPFSESTRIFAANDALTCIFLQVRQAAHFLVF